MTVISFFDIKIIYLITGDAVLPYISAL